MWEPTSLDASIAADPMEGRRGGPRSGARNRGTAVVKVGLANLSEFAAEARLSKPIAAIIRSSGLSAEFARYLVISLLALGIDTGTLVLLTEMLGVPYLLSAPAGFLLGMGTVYLGSIYWVFRRRRLSSAGEEIFFFAVIGVGGLLITEVTLWAVAGGLEIDYRIAKILAVGLSFMFNFVARKYFLFR